MNFRKTLFAFGVFFTLLTAGIITGDKDAKADTMANTQQGVVLKTTELKIQKTIVAPKKSEDTSTGSNRSTIYSRGTSNESTSVVEYAYNFLGRPYVFGAAGPRAFDCSGLTQYVYAKFGVSLPHYTGSQWDMGQSVSRGNLEAGDLVFFNTYGSLSHVGIYVGGGDFIHAPSSGKTVTISSLSESYYASRYAGAKRVK